MSSASQRVAGARWHGAVNGFADNAFTLEHLESFGEGAWVAVSDISTDLVETFAAVQEGTNDVQNPLLLKKRNGCYGWTQWLYLIHNFILAQLGILLYNINYYGIYTVICSGSPNRRNTYEPNLEH
jgi:hypothetical protein